MDTNMQPNTSRKRARENETESQKIKREKAAERQRRKRERDRRNAGMGIMAFPSAEGNQQQVPLQQQQEEEQEQHLQQQREQVQTQPQPQQSEYQELSSEERARKDRVRAAARERQRKHRYLVKQRRLRGLGLEVGNEMTRMQGMEEVHYRATPDGQYHPVMPPDLQQLPPHPQLEAPFLQGAPGGQTFASTLLLSFSCAPLLKQHLLRTLNMSNEELASLEPIIADAWDRWDHSRRMHYAEQVAKTGSQPPGMPPPYVTPAPPAPFPHPDGPGPADPNPAANDFRARFHRSIVGPTPFRTPFPENQTASTTTPSSASGSTHAETTIDPHLATNASGSAANETKGETVSVST